MSILRMLSFAAALGLELVGVIMTIPSYFVFQRDRAAFGIGIVILGCVIVGILYMTDKEPIEIDRKQVLEWLHFRKLDLVRLHATVSDSLRNSPLARFVPLHIRVNKHPH